MQSYLRPAKNTVMATQKSAIPMRIRIVGPSNLLRAWLMLVTPTKGPMRVSRYGLPQIVERRPLIRRVEIKDAGKRVLSVLPQCECGCSVLASFG